MNWESKIPMNKDLSSQGNHRTQIVKINSKKYVLKELRHVTYLPVKHAVDLVNTSIEEFNLALDLNETIENEFSYLTIDTERPILCVEFHDGFQFVLFEYLECLDQDKINHQSSSGFDISDLVYYSEAHDFVTKQFSEYFTTQSPDENSQLIQKCIQKLSFIEKLKLKWSYKALPEDDFKAAFQIVLSMFHEMSKYKYFQRKQIMDKDFDSESYCNISIKEGKYNVGITYYDLEFWKEHTDHRSVHEIHINNVYTQLAFIWLVKKFNIKIEISIRNDYIIAQYDLNNLFYSENVAALTKAAGEDDLIT